MNEKYTNSLIDSTRTYLNDLLFLGMNNYTTLHDLNTFKLIHRIYVWADWMNVGTPTLKKIAKVMECIIRSNSKLKLPTVVPGTLYLNTNTPQTDYTWRQVFNDPSVAVHETII